MSRSLRRPDRRRALSEADCRELEQLEAFLHRIDAGMSEKQAYAETYGQVVYEDPAAAAAGSRKN